MTAFTGHVFIPDCSLADRGPDRNPCEERKLIFRAQALSFLVFFFFFFQRLRALLLVSFAFSLSHRSDVKKFYLWMQFIAGVVSYEFTSKESNQSSSLLHFTRISWRVGNITGLLYHCSLTKNIGKIFTLNLSTLGVSLNSLIPINITVSGWKYYKQ